MRENIELSREEIIKISKRQLVMSYILGILFSLLGIAVVAILIVDAVNNKNRRVASIIISIILALMVVDYICKLIKKIKSNKNFLNVYNSNLETKTITLKPISHKYQKFNPVGVSMDDNLYYAFISLIVEENNNKVEYTYASRRPLKVNVDDLLTDKEIECTIFEDTHVIDTISIIEKEKN